MYPQRISQRFKHPSGWLVAHQPTVRYKWNGVCPDCGNKVIEEIGKGHPNSNRAIYIDCMKCGYNATGYLTPKSKRHYMYGWFTGQRKADVWIFSETISPLEKASRDMKWHKERIDDMMMEMRQ